MSRGSSVAMLADISLREGVKGFWADLPQDFGCQPSRYITPITASRQ
jgi:hypothetical protein